MHKKQKRRCVQATSLRFIRLDSTETVPYAVGGADATGGAPDAGPTAASPSFTRSFSSLLGLKNGIFFAGTSTRSPVLGLRPTRGRRWRVRKLPKPRISI